MGKFEEMIGGEWVDVEDVDERSERIEVIMRWYKFNDFMEDGKVEWVRIGGWNCNCFCYNGCVKVIVILYSKLLDGIFCYSLSEFISFKYIKR